MIKTALDNLKNNLEQIRSNVDFDNVITMSIERCHDNTYYFAIYGGSRLQKIYSGSCPTLEQVAETIRHLILSLFGSTEATLQVSIDNLKKQGIYIDKETI